MIETLELLQKAAVKYRKTAQETVIRNNHMNDLKGDEKISQETIDAVLVDYINFIAMKAGLDYGLYTEDLKEK